MTAFAFWRIAPVVSALKTARFESGAGFVKFCSESRPFFLFLSAQSFIRHRATTGAGWRQRARAGAEAAARSAA